MISAAASASPAPSRHVARSALSKAAAARSRGTAPAAVRQALAEVDQPSRSRVSARLLALEAGHPAAHRWAPFSSSVCRGDRLALGHAGIDHACRDASGLGSAGTLELVVMLLPKRTCRPRHNHHISMMDAEFKVCFACKQSKPISSFQRDFQKGDSWRTWCRDCRAAKERKYRAAWRKRREGCAEPVSKRCSKCGENLPIDQFARDRARPDGFHVWCKSCRNPLARQQRKRRHERNPEHYKLQARIDWLRRKYGLSIDQVEEMLLSQNSSCAICSEPLDKSAHIDHDHQTGAVRGILCGLCNQGLGQFRDNPQLCARAAAYLRRHLAARDTPRAEPLVHTQAHPQPAVLAPHAEQLHQ